MKVALCFSGMPRFVAQTHKYWKNCLLDPYQPDVFVHTWKTDDVYENQSIASTIQSLYSPVVCSFEHSVHHDVTLYSERIWPHRTTPQNQISQYTSIKRSLELRRYYENVNNFCYDIVIRARFDWFLEEIILEINDSVNVAHTPTLVGHRFNFNGQSFLGISDQFAYGSSDNMTTYSQLVDNIPNLYSNYQIDFCGELLLKSHLLYHNINVTEHIFNNGIVRNSGIMP